MKVFLDQEAPATIFSGYRHPGFGTRKVIQIA
jgi:hypothetical protein